MPYKCSCIITITVITVVKSRQIYSVSDLFTPFFLACSFLCEPSPSASSQDNRDAKELKSKLQI